MHAASKLTASRLGLPNLGLGVGLRHPHFQHILAHGPQVDWFEIISENFIDNHGYARHVLDTVAAQVPIVMHGVSLSIGSSAPLDMTYLHKLRALAGELKPAWISDHLCWTGAASLNSHDLLPMPLDEASLRHVAGRVAQVQDFLGRPLILENPSSYVEFASSSMPEWEFLGRLAQQTGCGLLLDVNNVHVSAYNHGFDAVHYIEQLPHAQIVQIHLAGPTDCGEVLIDTHDAPVPQAVWRLYALAQRLTGGVSALLEWDANIPPYPQLLAELAKARAAELGCLPTRQSCLAPARHCRRRWVFTWRPAMQSELAQLQGWFLTAMTCPGGAPQGAALAQKRFGLAPEQVLTRPQRLSIYADGYVLRLLDCLQAEFPVLRQTMGLELFDFFARAYLWRHPSRSSTLYDLGAGFADFLAASQPQGQHASGAAILQFPIDLARLERARAEAGRAVGLENRTMQAQVPAGASMALAACWAGPARCCCCCRLARVCWPCRFRYAPSGSRRKRPVIRCCRRSRRPEPAW